MAAPSEAARWRLHDFSGDWLDAIDTWLTGPGRTRKARRLVLQGESSTGKTSLACAVAHQWWSAGQRTVIFATVDSTDLLRPEVQRLGPLGPDTLVVLDDFGPLAIRWPSFRALITQLDAAGCRIVTTTNLRPSEWRDDAQVDPPVRERLNPDGCLFIPLTEHLAGAPPEVAGAGPCPYSCELPGVFAMGHLAKCAIPEVAALTEAFIEAEMEHQGSPPDYYGLHRPSPGDYAELEPDEAQEYLAAAYRRWDSAFDWHAANTAHWCPHCRPEQCRPDGWLERRLAALGRPLVGA